MSIKIVTIVTALLLLTWGACTGERIAQADEPYNLGVALGLTGPGSLYSNDGLAAITLAVEEINAQGGFLGKHKIELFVKDTKTEAQEAKRVVNELVKEKVRTVLGTYSSDTALAIKPICREHKVLHIAAISNSEDITMKDFSPYTFSVVPNSYMQSKAVALGVSKLAKEKNWITYCTIASDYSWGRSSQLNLVEFLKKDAPRLKLVRDFWPPLGEKRFGGFIRTAWNYRPDCLIGFLASNDNVEWLRQAGAEDLFRKIPYHGSLLSVSELTTEARTVPRGVIALARAPFFAHLDVPMMTRFMKSFQEKHKRYPSDWAVLEYDAVYALKQAVEKAKSVDTEAVKDAMKGMTIETCRGKLKFREIDNQLGCSSYIGVVSDDPKYHFPIFSPLWEIKGPDSMRPEKEILEARGAGKKP
ncbi:MAG: ABC transporter substrate-binding protein [Thermodesulfobacteriota bacterium]